MFNRLFAKKEKPIKSYKDFWDWFILHEKKFHKIIKKGNSQDITKNFFDKIAPKLNELKEGIWYLTGMYDDDTADLILTVDGDLKLIYLVEELVEQAPKLKNWKFQAHKPEHSIENSSIKMAGFEFSNATMSFYANELENYPDEIDLVIIHNDLNEENENDIINGCYIFIDNFLGELNSLTLIDNITFKKKDEAESKLIPIKKLKEFLIWREKEFIEKYEGKRKVTENDTFLSYEGKTSDDKPLLAVMNSDLLNWDKKASHPWFCIVKINYDGHENGLPSKDDYDLLGEIEEELNQRLHYSEGYLNIGRETGDNLREIYFACKEFKYLSKFIFELIEKRKNEVDIKFVLFKDKYWQTLNRFIV